MALTRNQKTALFASGGMMVLILGALVFLLVQVAGGPAPATSAAAGEPAVAPSEINACAFLTWVGKPVDRTAVEAIGRPYRVMRRDSLVTEDYMAQRINLMVDDEGIVTDVRCY